MPVTVIDVIIILLTCMVRTLSDSNSSNACCCVYFLTLSLTFTKATHISFGLPIRLYMTIINMLYELSSASELDIITVKH